MPQYLPHCEVCGGTIRRAVRIAYQEVRAIHDAAPWRDTPCSCERPVIYVLASVRSRVLPAPRPGAVAR